MTSAAGTRKGPWHARETFGREVLTAAPDRGAVASDGSCGPRRFRGPKPSLAIRRTTGLSVLARVDAAFAEETSVMHCDANRNPSRPGPGGHGRGVLGVQSGRAAKPARPVTAKPPSSARIRWPTPPISTRSSARTIPSTVTLIANYYPMQDPAGFPNFYRFGDDVTYRINIDNNGDAVEDIFYQWDFATEIVNPELVPLQLGTDRLARQSRT